MRTSVYCGLVSLLGLCWLTLPMLPLSEAVCNPSNSVANSSIVVSITGGGSGSTCFFPFIDSSTMYSDCAQYCSGSLCRYWCPTTCNYATSSSQWRYCNYRLSDLSLPNCSNLATAAPSVEPSILYSGGAGTQCVFPFLYNGKCYNDCITTYLYPWCATSTESALNNNNYKYCAYTIAGISTPECAKLNESAPAYITPQLTSYAYLINQSDPYANCTFPFYYNGKCYDDCTTGAGLPWYLPWCISERYYEPNRRFRFCPYYRKYASISNLALRWGFYRIYLQSGCPGNSLCNASIAPAASGVPAGAQGSRRLAVTFPTAGSSAQMWEALPQPNGFFIFRTVVPCYTPAYAWSTDSSDATFENITSEREFWIITSAGESGGSGIYTIQSSYNSTAGYYLTPTTVSGYSVLTIQPGVTTNWVFVEISELEKSQLSVCDKLDINGGWCAWSNYTRIGDWQMRTRNCSCPVPAVNGTTCAGNATEWASVVNGSWCSWSGYQLTGGGSYAMKIRVCNCTAPAYGGLDCVGSGNDTGLVVNGTWCAWSSYVTNGAYGSRVRNCSCPEPAYTGLNCLGAGNDTGSVVNGSWCSWSAFTVMGSVGVRNRSCGCSTPAYGGIDCPGNATEVGSVINGTWCAWGPYQISADGLTSSRQRVCNCSAPANGGIDCQGSNNETGSVVNGTWCSWSVYQVSGSFSTRVRACSCSAPAYGGGSCPGNDTETLSVVNGTWCSWGPYIISGAYSSRTRICNCSAPAFGGEACPGVDNETQAVINGSWCAWTPYTVSGGYGTRLRYCNCSTPAYGGSVCPGAFNDTGITVNVAWCAWSAYTVNAGIGMRMRNCSCPSASAYGGNATCLGASNDTGPAVNASWCAWSAFMADGAGNETRQRNCSCPSSSYGGTATCLGVGIEARAIVNGTWCTWNSWFVSNGWGNRNRTCNCSAPSALGAPCPGNSSDGLAQVNGTWCSWSALFSGYGQILRTRRCNCSAPNAVGADCPGSDTESYPCNSTNCMTTTAAPVDGAWCEWSGYTAGPINSGYMWRTRNCSCPSATGSTGKACPGSGLQNVTCQLEQCQKYMAVPVESGSTGASISDLSSFSKIVGFTSALCVAAFVSLAVGAAITLYKLASQTAVAATVVSVRP